MTGTSATASVLAGTGSAPAVPTLVAPANARRHTYSPVLSAQYSDSEGDPGTVTFTVRGQDNLTVVRTVTSGQVASGATASVDLGTSPLPEGWYYWSARASDGTSSSAESASRWFETSTAAPSDPGVGVKRFYRFEDYDLSDRTQLRVNVANGNLVLRAKELVIRGTAGHDLVLERVYNTQRTMRRELGNGWALGRGRQVGLYFRANGNIVFEDQTQARWLFTPPASGNVWTEPTGIDAELKELTNGQFELRYRKEGSVLAFSPGGQLRLVKDRNGNLLDPRYTEHRLTQIVDTQGRVTKVNTTAATNLVSGIEDPAARTTTYLYDLNDDLVSATDLNGKIWLYAYNNHNLTKVTDPRGNDTLITYGAGEKVSKIVQVTDKLAGTGPTTLFSYYAAGACPTSGVSGACTVVTDPNTKATTYQTDPLGRVEKTVDANGHASATTWTSRSMVQDYTGPGGTTAEAQIAYQAGTDRVTSVTRTDAGTSTFSYADPNNPDAPSSYQAPQGNSISYSYRAGSGNLASINADRYSFDYHPDGTLSTSSQPNLTTPDPADRVTTSYTYTGGNLTGVDLPAPLGDVAFSVDGLSRVTARTDGKGEQVSYEYDRLDRLTKASYAASGVVAVYSYDGNGNRTARSVTGLSPDSTYGYDALNRLTDETTPNGVSGADVKAYRYDPVGNLIEHTVNAVTTGYTYTAVNLVDTLTLPGGQLVRYGYEPDHDRSKVIYPNGIEQWFSYNGAHNVTRIRAGTPDGTGTTWNPRHTDLAYEYRKPGSASDDTNLRSRVVDAVAGQATAYSYEPTYAQLSRALTTSTSTGATVADYQYGYDANGNRASATAGNTSTAYTYNAAGEMTQAGTDTYSYDANGNLTAGGGLSLAYNDRDQTTSLNGAGAVYADTNQAERIAYNGNERVNTILGLSQYRYGSAQVSAHRDPVGDLAALDIGGAKSYPLTDALGSVIGLTNSTGARTDSYAYDPYGQHTNAGTTATNLFRFTGEERDHTGLDKIGMRYYQPGTGRWTQPDPKRHLNPANPPEGMPWVYAANNPINYTDPTGTLTDTECDIISAVILSMGFFGLETAAAIAGATLVGGIVLGSTLLIAGIIITIGTTLEDTPC